MAKRKAANPRRRQRRVIQIDQMVKGAFERNGVNTILLDIRDGLTEAVGRIGHLELRDSEARDSRRIMHDKLDYNSNVLAGMKEVVERIAPLVDSHEALVQQKIGKDKLKAEIGRWVTKGRAAVAALTATGAGGAILAWLHWPWWGKPG